MNEKLKEIKIRNENDCLFYEDIKWLIETISKQQILIESQSRVLEGFIGDMEDIKFRLNEVRENIKTAKDTISLEDHDEALYGANKSLNYIIDFALSEIDEGLKQ